MSLRSGPGGPDRWWPRAVVPAARWVALASLLLSFGLVATGEPAAVDPAPPVPGRSEPVPVAAAGTPEVDRSRLEQQHVWQPPELAWPAPGQATVALTSAATAAGDLPVTVAAAGRAPAAVAGRPEAVRVEVLDRAAAGAAGIDGLLLRVVPVPGAGDVAAGEVELAVDYSAFTGAYGGAWASRLRLVQLPACVLTTPQRPGCRAASGLASANDTTTRTVSATVPVAADPGSGSVFAVTAGGTSESGDWTATDLAAAGTWMHDGSSGAMTYSYPLRLPPAAGPMPEISLTYSSQAHDGLTSGSNNQASWVGDGWTYQPGFIERTYRTCARDMDGGNNDLRTGDLCWDGDSPALTIALNGLSTSLVRDDGTGRWRAADDQGWRIERLGSPATPGSGTSERWVVTTPDGTRYFFAGAVSSSKSRWTVPVFGNNSGEACHAGEFADSACRQAYRWLLDRVVDTSGNLTRFYYGTETGHYAAAGDPDDRRSYHRGGRLTRVDYGLRAGGSGPATARVDFIAADRCLDNCWDGADPRAEHWPDTPWDLSCDATPCWEQGSPAFFSTKRLSKVITRVRDGGGFRDVDSWRLAHEFLDYGDESQVVLWLKSIEHTGHVAGAATLPKTSFTGWALPNRVDHNGVAGVWRSRLSAITSEVGGITTINYSEPDCGAGDLPPDPHRNDRLCYPTWWTPALHDEPVRDWFHKYVVTSIAEQETVASGGMVWTFFDYATAGGGTSTLWAWDDSEFTDDDHRTYRQWRGYPQVTTRVGDPAEGPQLTTRTRFYRGMDGQPLPGGGQRSVRLTDSEGNQVSDHPALAGAAWESVITSSGSVDSAVTYRYWTRKTASREHDGGTAKAWLSAVERRDTRKRLTGSVWRRTRTTTSYDPHGRVVRTSEQGDLARGGDERCTRTEYADNPSAGILAAVSRTETVAVPCGTTPERPADVVSDQRVYYDGSSALGAAPTRGLPTRSEVLDSWDGGPSYVTVESVEYDALGRPVAETDALGHTSATRYTPSGAGPVTRRVATNPLGHETVTDIEPAWGQPEAIVDANGRRTGIDYDPLGRLTKVWLPGRDQASESPHAVFEYAIRNHAPSVLTTKRINASGDYATTTELFDSLYRKIQDQSDTPQGGRLVTETAYNSRGQVEYQSGPNWDEASGPDRTFVRVEQGADHARSWYTYDPLGREVRQELWSKNTKLWQATTGYGGSSDGFLVRVTPPDGGVPTGTVTDVRGNRLQTRDYHGDTATGPYDATRFGYDPKGRLASVTDPAGNAWSFGYDLRGRRIRSHDPDSGTSAAGYDAAGRVTSTTDARGERRSTVYDQLDRPVQRWAGPAGTGELIAGWSYDTVAGGVGLPATASAFVAGQEIVTRVGAYDAAGRPTRATTTVPPIPGLEELAGSYPTIQRFNVDGTVATLALPAVGGLPREGITFTYNDLGQPERMVGSLITTFETQVYVDSASYTAWGELAQRTLGASYQNQVYHSYSYADGTRRRTDFRLSRDAVGAPNVAHLQYEYDDAGNVLSIADAVEDAPGEPERQCFVYDHLRRLTEAWAQAGVDPCAEAPSVEAMGGPAPYWSSYTFDVTGNRTSETQHHLDGSSQTSSYAYPGHGGPQPHTLSSVTTGGQVDSYSYDAAGNLTSRTVDGATETIDWDAAGKPVAITDDTGAVTRMVYNSDGSRIARIDGNGDAHLFLAGHQISYTAATGRVTAVRSYLHNGEVVATRSTIDGLQWLAGDHHGTARWAIDADSMAVTYRRQDPYGNPRGPQRSWPAGQEGFVRGIEDPTGLVHIGARSYDPATGRFISDDPVTDFQDGQQINGYTYANGSPVTNRDPTGSLLVGGAGSDGGKRHIPNANPKPPEPSLPSGPLQTGGNVRPVADQQYLFIDSGFEPFLIGEVQYTQQTENGDYVQITANAYVWCNEWGSRCSDDPRNGQIFIGLVVTEILYVVVGKQGPYLPGQRPPSGELLLYQATCVNNTRTMGENQEVADQVVVALATAGTAIQAGDTAAGVVRDHEKLQGRKAPRGLKLAGKFAPWAGFGASVATSVREGKSVPEAVVEEGAAAAAAFAAGRLAGAAAAPLAGLICGPGAPLCAALITGAVGLAAGAGAGYLADKALEHARPAMRNLVGG